MDGVAPTCMYHPEVVSKMNARLVTASVAAAALLCSVTLGADLKSGPQKGERVTPFNPLHATGPNKGSKQCLV
jgi:hypothetical protein